MKRSTAIILLYILIVLFSTQFFRFSFYKEFTGGFDFLYYVLYPLIFIWGIQAFRMIHSNLIYAKLIFSMGFVSFLCIITYIIKGGSFDIRLALPPILFSMTIFSYFLLVKYSVNEYSLIKAVLIVGFCIALIQIIQQLFPSIAVFGTLNTDDSYLYGDIASMRNNLYRFLLPTYQISLFCLFYSWSKLLEKKNISTFIIFICFAASVYLYLTRQIIFTTLAVLILSPFFTRNRSRLSAVVISLLFIVFLLIFSTSLFSSFIEMTREGGNSADNRLEAYSFFGNKILESPLTLLFGNGTPSDTLVWHEMGLNASDIGIVGEVFHKGIFSLLIYVALLYYMLLKYKKYTPIYIRLYVFYTLLNSIMLFPYILGHDYFLWAIIIYIAEMKSRYKYTVI